MAKTKIVFLILPRIHLLDFAGAAQVFYEATAHINLEYCGVGETVETSTQFPLGDLKRYDSINFQKGDYLLVPGAEVAYFSSRKLATDKKLFDWVRAAYASGVHVGSICTGAFFLGLTGLLDGRKCTTHWKYTDELARRFPAIRLQEDVLFTEDERILTSAGVTTGIDLALHILTKLTNEAFAFKAARELVVYIRRSGGDSQQSIFMKYRNHVHSGVHRVQDYLQDSPEKKVSLDRLADEACMSTRSLTRVFKRETGVTVREYVNEIRKERLAVLSKNPDLTRRQLATLCGLKSERQVIRILQQM